MALRRSPSNRTLLITGLAFAAAKVVAGTTGNLLVNPGAETGDLAVAFIDASSGPGWVFTPPIDSHNLSWQNYSGSVAIPPGTRFIEYDMVFFRNVGIDLDAFVDNNNLTVTTPAQGVPESLGYGWVWASLLGLVPLAEYSRQVGVRVKPAEISMSNS
jgi:hypothetical protein